MRNNGSEWRGLETSQRLNEALKGGRGNKSCLAGTHSRILIGKRQQDGEGLMVVMLEGLTDILLSVPVITLNMYSYVLVYLPFVRMYACIRMPSLGCCWYARTPECRDFAFDFKKCTVLRAKFYLAFPLLLATYKSNLV